jgi:hypothetical protein
LVVSPRDLTKAEIEHLQDLSNQLVPKIWESWLRILWPSE